jgi:hypothetical protein
VNAWEVAALLLNLLPRPTLPEIALVVLLALTALVVQESRKR